MKSRAIKIKIPYNPILLATTNEYTKAVRFIADEGYKVNIINRYKLHHLCYHKVRETGLPSQFVINANRVASQTLKSVKTNKGSKPSFKRLLPLAFDKRSSTFKGNIIKLTTIKGRVAIDLDIPEYYWKYLDWNYQTTNLVIDKKNRMFLNITFAKDINIRKTGLQLGVDVGINHVAVTSTKQFFSGKAIKVHRIKFKRLKARLQSKGTRSSQKRLKIISGRERRYMAYWNHVISKRIIDGCEATTIILENLKGIRKMKRGRKINFWLHGWSFYQLQNFISYKAAVQGIKTIKVNPYMTSQICSYCGKVGIRSKGFFKCLHCGYSLNSDLNASYNLAKHHSKSDDVSASVTMPHIQMDDFKGTFCAIANDIMDKISN